VRGGCQFAGATCAPATGAAIVAAAQTTLSDRTRSVEALLRDAVSRGIIDVPPARLIRERQVKQNPEAFRSRLRMQRKEKNCHCVARSPARR
jgi:hypothetical protein